MFHVLRAILVLEYNVQPVNPPANGDNGMAEYCTKALHDLHFAFYFLLLLMLVVVSFTLPSRHDFIGSLG